MAVDDEHGPESPASVVTAAALVYSLLVGLALLWLWWRDDLPALGPAAVGAMGPWADAGIGLATGLLGALLLALLSRRVAAIAAIEARIAGALGPMGETPLLSLALLSAVAEELLFRLAGQRALGVPGSVALYVLMNTGPGFWAWAPLAFVFGLSWSLLVAAGCGLLTVATAHALLNYFSLRRILPS